MKGILTILVVFLFSLTLSSCKASDDEDKNKYKDKNKDNPVISRDKDKPKDNFVIVREKDKPNDTVVQGNPISSKPDNPPPPPTPTSPTPQDSNSTPTSVSESLKPEQIEGIRVWNKKCEDKDKESANNLKNTRLASEHNCAVISAREVFIANILFSPERYIDNLIDIDLENISAKYIEYMRDLEKTRDAVIEAINAWNLAAIERGKAVENYVVGGDVSAAKAAEAEAKRYESKARDAIGVAKTSRENARVSGANASEAWNDRKDEAIVFPSNINVPLFSLDLQKGMWE
jgi:hypothetical protein